MPSGFTLARMAGWPPTFDQDEDFGDKPAYITHTVWPASKTHDDGATSDGEGEQAR
jgi:hypothetical protein